MALLQKESNSVEEESEEKPDVVENTPMTAGDPVATAAAASVLFSWYQFYVKGDKETGLFVGLWAPTLLTAANYVQQKDAIRKFKQTLSTF